MLRNTGRAKALIATTLPSRKIETINAINRGAESMIKVNPTTKETTYDLKSNSPILSQQQIPCLVEEIAKDDLLNAIPYAFEQI